MALHLKYTLKNFKEAVIFYVKNLYRHLYDDEVYFLASGIAFNGVLCLIPILLLFTSIFGIVLNSSGLAVQKIQEILGAAFPDQPYAQSIKSSIQQIIKDIIEYRQSFGLFGLGVLTWTATSLFSSVRTVLNRIYQIKSTKLVILTILEDVIWVSVVGILFVLIMIATWLYTLVENIIHILPGFASIEFVYFEQTLPLILSLVLTVLMFFIVYRFIPDKHITWKVALISAITAGLLWITAGKLFAWYLATFHSFSKLYGTYAFLLVLLVWVFYSSVVFVVGAIIGQVYRERHKVSNEPSSSDI
jgi:membrane protein